MTERTVGIDLSSRPPKTVICPVDWQDDEAFVQPPQRRATDAALESVLASTTLVGIDVPLGWPTPFVDAIVAHREFEAWPGAVGDERRLLYRATDRFVWSQTRRPPLSVAADRIAWPAIRAARLLSQLSRRRRRDRSGASGTVVEVYPAAAIFRWTDTHPHYKSGAGAAAVRAVAKMLVRPWMHFSDAASADLYEGDEDCFDALVCALVARAHGKELCEMIPAEDAEAARIEGWIALPKAGSLDKLP